MMPYPPRSHWIGLALAGLVLAFLVWSLAVSWHDGFLDRYFRIELTAILLAAAFAIYWLVRLVGWAIGRFWLGPAA